MKVLFVTYGLPYPPISGTKIRDFQLIRAISEHAEVYLCSLLTPEDEPDGIAQMRKYCQRVETCALDRRPILADLTLAARGWLKGRPLATHPFFYLEMASKIGSLIAEEDIDIVEIEHSVLACYRNAVPTGSRCRAILSFQNLGSRQYRRMTHLQTGARAKVLFHVKALLMRGWEARLAGRFHHCVAVSAEEADLLLKENPSLSISIVENGVDTQEKQVLTEASHGNNLLFVGALGYPPNADAVLYFCKSILPLIRRAEPDARLWVVGPAPPRMVLQLAEQDHVTVTGLVNDVTPYYQLARVSVAPLRGGGGTRLKILESMALGRPVVSTTIGCEGLSVSDGEHLLLADTPSEFANRVIRLLREPTLRQAVIHRARTRVEEQYEWSAMGRRLFNVYCNLLEARQCDAPV